MATLGQRSFPLGWIPSDDSVNGRIEGLLRMDNLILEEKGIISIMKGTERVSPVQSSAITEVFSRIFNSQKHRYIYTGTTCKKDINEVETFGTTVLSGGGTLCSFGVALGHVLICSGTQKKKDDGSTVSDLGVAAPGSAPSIATSSKTEVSADGGHSSGYAAIENEDTLVFSADNVQFDTSLTSFGGVHRGIIQKTGLTLDLTDFGGTGNDTPEDDFSAEFQSADSEKIRSVQIDYYLDTPGKGANAYTIQFRADDNPVPFQPGIDQWSTLRAKRKDFKRVGKDPSLNWSNIVAIRVSVVATEGDINFAWGEAEFVGGTGLVPRNGTYEYLQVNVDLNSGAYNGLSPISDKVSIVLDNQSALVTPASLASADEAWIYRRNISDEDPFYYRVATRSNTTQFEDTVLDIDARRNPIALESLEALPDNIIDIVGNYFDRTIYITNDKVHVSPRLNPGAVDAAIELDTSNDESEKNLFIKKVSNSQMLLGTTRDIYSLSGTGQQFPDGTIDFRLIPLGIANPPISGRGVTVYNGALIYMATDGVRMLQGSTQRSLNHEMRLLFENEARHGILAVQKTGADGIKYDMAVSGNKLFFTTILSDANFRRVYILDLIEGRWFPYFNNPLALYTEEDDTLLGGFGDPGDQYLRKIFSGSNLIDQGDSDTKPNFRLITPFIDNGQPNNRKDVALLTILHDTGGDNVTIRLAVDGSASLTSLGDFSSSGWGVEQIELHGTAIDLAKRFQLDIKDAGDNGVSDYKLAYWTIDYNPRPEQRKTLEILPTNFGDPRKKRIRTLPMRMDTLGNTVTFTPRVDGVNKTATTHSSSEPRTHNSHFTEDVLGIDYGGTLVAGSGVFEFYELHDPALVEIFPVGKRLDQFGPFIFEEFGKFTQFRIRVYPLGTSISYTLYAQDGSIRTGTITVVANVNDIYTEKLPKGLKARVARLELSSDDEFHPYWAQFYHLNSGGKTLNKKILAAGVENVRY